MPRLDLLPEIQRNTLLTHPALLNDTAPFTPLARPLSASRLALVTTAGIHPRGDRPFTGGDQSFRVLPSSIPKADIVVSHVSIGFDRAGILSDLNVVFPVDRLRELVALGEVGSLGTTNYSFMGAQRTYDTLLHDSGPEVARRLREDGVEVVLLTGA